MATKPVTVGARMPALLHNQVNPMPAKPATTATKSDDRRAAIIERLADHVLAHGLTASSLRPLAKAAATSDRMLLYYFKDKNEIVAATLECISARMVVLMGPRTASTPQPFAALRAQLAAIVRDPVFWPYMRVWLETASRAAHGDPLFRAVGESIGRGFLAWGAAQLDSPDEATRARDAAQLLVMTEGLVLLTALGLDDVCQQALQS